MMLHPVCSSLAHFKPCHKIFSPGAPLCSVKYSTVQHLFSSIHHSGLATDLSVWTDVKHSLMTLAVNTLPLLNACTTFTVVWYGRAWLSSVWCSCARYFDALCNGELLFPCIRAIPLHIFPVLNEFTNVMFACKMHEFSCSYIPIWWEHKSTFHPL